jgi:hypothetical protein
MRLLAHRASEDGGRLRLADRQGTPFQLFERPGLGKSAGQLSRALNLAMSETDVLGRCRDAGVGVSALELLPSGGVRLVCMSMAGADLVRRLLSKKIIQGNVERQKFRPSRPLW